MKYYAIINNVKLGPLSPGELLSLGMTRDTLVWREGMTEWMAAWRLPELDSCFYTVAPGGGSNPRASLPECPPTYLAWALVVTICCCQIPGIVAVVYSVCVESRYSRGDIDGAKRASQAALIWIWITVGLALLSIAVMIPLQILPVLLNL